MTVGPLRRNLPTPEGRVAGAILAKLCDEREALLIEANGPVPPRCADCAARAGADANGCLPTLNDFAECVATGEPFYCHAGIDINRHEAPRLICRGWIAMAAPDAVERVAAIIAEARAATEGP